MKPYGKLMLYGAIIPSPNIPEFDVSQTGLIEFQQEFVTEALEYIKETFLDKDIYPIHMNHVKMASDAPILIEYAKQNIKGSEGQLEILNCRDSKLTFRRNIIFIGWAKSKKSELIKKLIRSGYDPFASEVFDQERAWGRNMAFFPDDDIDLGLSTIPTPN